MIYLLALLISILPTNTNLETTISKPIGEIRDAVDKDFEPFDINSKYYSETWTYHFFLEKDIHIVYTISLNDIGNFKERVGGAKLLVNWKNGRNYTINKEYPYRDFYYNAINNELGLNVDKPYKTYGSLDSVIHVEFRTGKNGINYDIDLVMKDIIKGKIWGDGTYKFNNQSFGINILVAQAEVSGTVAVDGDTLSVKGIGYMDHQYQTFNSTKQLFSGLRFFSGDKKAGRVGNFQFLRNNRVEPRLIGYSLLIKNGKAIFNEVSDVEFSNPMKLKGGRLNTVYDLTFTDNKKYHLEIEKRLLDFSILDELNSFMRAIARNVLGAEIVEFIVSGKNQSSQPVYFNGYILK